MANENTNTALVQVQSKFLKEVEDMALAAQIPLDEYAKTCVITAASAAFTFVNERGITFNELDISKFRASLQGVALHKLNIANGEVFVDYHKGWKGVKSTLVFTIQGNGYETIVNRFGQGVGHDANSLSHYWAVREGDHFELPQFNGFEIKPPVWQPKFDSTKKVIYVVYGLRKRDDSIEWLIRDRESVKANLGAHIINSGRSYFKDNKKALEQVNAYVEEHTLDELLASGNKAIDELLGIVRNDDTPTWISPAWTSPNSREAMIVRKMRNNCLRSYPLDFDNVAYKTALQALDDDTDKTVFDSEEQSKEPTDAPKLEDFDCEAVEVETKETEKPQAEQPKAEESKIEITSTKYKDPADDLPF